jgi:hypothetical protein
MNNGLTSPVAARLRHLKPSLALALMLFTGARIGLERLKERRLSLHIPAKPTKKYTGYAGAPNGTPLYFMLL